MKSLLDDDDFDQLDFLPELTEPIPVLESVNVTLHVQPDGIWAIWSFPINGAVFESWPEALAHVLHPVNSKIRTVRVRG